MNQASQALTPPEILDAGHKAEADGRIAYAVQFYRHLTNYYARTPEAADARQALHRLNALPDPDPAVGQSFSRAVESARTIAPVRAAPRALAPARSQSGTTAQSGRRAVVLPAPTNGFWIGRALAVLLLIVGGLAVAGGIALFGHGLLLGSHRPLPAGLSLIGTSAMVAAPSLILGGLLMALVGQVATAVFRMSNASADIAAITRARFRHDSGEE